MRFLTLTICLLIAVNLYGQKKKQLADGNYFKIQGGVIHDSTSEGYFDYPSNNTNLTPEELINPKLTYTGIKVLNIGIGKLRKDILKEFEIEIIAYHKVADTTFVEYPSYKYITGGWAKKRISVELKYFRSLISIGENRNRLFLGPTGSIIYIENRITPTISSHFPLKEHCACLGLGAKADYMLMLSKRINFNISSSIALLDLGHRRETVDNPSLTSRQARYVNGFDAKLLRNQFQLNVGFRFKL